MRPALESARLLGQRTGSGNAWPEFEGVLMATRWAIFGTGGISAKFVLGLARARQARAVLVASRTGARARRFADALQIERSIEGYAEAARAGGFDAAYIATPTSEHVAHALLCIEAGIPLLVEKPLAMSAADGRRIADAARAAGVFCMEAMWTRFLPAVARLRQLVAAGELGDIRQVSGSFGFGYAFDPALHRFDPARGGGALSHLGIYPLSLAQMLLGAPEQVRATGRIGDSGVDEDVTMALRYRNGALASLATSIRAPLGNGFRVSATHGAATLAGPVFRPWGLRIRRHQPRIELAGGAGLSTRAKLREGHLAQRLNQWRGLLPAAAGGRHFFAGNGYHYEAEEVARCLASGWTESPLMPLADSIAVLDTMDRVRHEIGRKGQA